VWVPSFANKFYFFVLWPPPPGHILPLGSYPLQFESVRHRIKTPFKSKLQSFTRQLAFKTIPALRNTVNSAALAPFNTDSGRHTATTREWSALQRQRLSNVTLRLAQAENRCMAPRAGVWRCQQEPHIFWYSQILVLAPSCPLTTNNSNFVEYTRQDSAPNRIECLAFSCFTNRSPQQTHCGELCPMHPLHELSTRPAQNPCVSVTHTITLMCMMCLHARVCVFGRAHGYTHMSIHDSFAHVFMCVSVYLCVCIHSWSIHMCGCIP